MKFLFQMDDPKKININEDSTYMLIKESLNRGKKIISSRIKERS